MADGTQNIKNYKGVTFQGQVCSLGINSVNWNSEIVLNTYTVKLFFFFFREYQHTEKLSGKSPGREMRQERQFDLGFVLSLALQFPNYVLRHPWRCNEFT